MLNKAQAFAQLDRATLTGKQLNECYTFDHLDSLGFHS